MPSSSPENEDFFKALRVPLVVFAEKKAANSAAPHVARALPSVCDGL